MPREPKAMGPARTAARLVYPDSDLSDQGSELLDRWAERAELLEEEQVEELWSQDHRLVMNAFRGTEGALAGLNRWRAEEEEEPLDRESLEGWFRFSEDWELAYLGSYQDHSIRVWSYSPFDGHLAYAVARGEESVAAAGISLA